MAVKIKKKIDLAEKPEPVQKIINQHVCCACGETNESSFIISRDFFRRFFHKYELCNNCIKDYFNIKFNETSDLKVACFYTCCKLDIPFLLPVFDYCVEKNSLQHFMLAYLKKLNNYTTRANDNSPDTFWGSDEFYIGGLFYSVDDLKNITESQNKKIEALRDELRKEVMKEGFVKKSEEPMDELTEMYKKDTFKTLGYDPFSEDSDEDKVFEYSYFVNLVGDDQLIDPYVLQVMVNIVRLQMQLNRITKTINAILSDQDDSRSNSKQLKELNGVASQINTQINSLAKENNISLRGQKDKGDSKKKLTFIMSQLSDYDYEDAKVNAFNIKTSNVMRDVAKISLDALRSQFNISENDFEAALENQVSKISDLELKLSKEKEESRKKSRQIEKLENQLQELMDNQKIKSVVKPSYTTQPFEVKQSEDDYV